MADNIEIIESKMYAAAVADEIVATIGDVLTEKSSCSLALSGGSTPGAIYRLLSTPPRLNEIEWGKLDIYWGDERYVPHDNANSNFRMTNETMLVHLNKSKPRVHPVPTDMENPDESAGKYSEIICTTQNLKQGEQPKFDIVLLGIGEDGHIASLFPSDKALKSEKHKICVKATHPDGSVRISLTQHAIFNARKILFLVKGAGKADIINEVINGNKDPEEIPARFYLNARDRVTFFIDSEAAKTINS